MKLYTQLSVINPRQPVVVCITMLLVNWTENRDKKKDNREQEETLDKVLRLGQEAKHYGWIKVD